MHTKQSTRTITIKKMHTHKHTHISSTDQVSICRYFLKYENCPNNLNCF